MEEGISKRYSTSSVICGEEEDQNLEPIFDWTLFQVSVLACRLSTVFVRMSAAALTCGV